MIVTVKYLAKIGKIVGFAALPGDDSGAVDAFYVLVAIEGEVLQTFDPGDLEVLSIESECPGE